MKKILALVLTLTMVLGTFTFAAAAPEDVVGTDCEDAVARLMALDIISGFPDGTYKPDEPVTRAQFAKIIVSALGVGEAANYAAGATKFADVPADHWATGYINVAVDLGVIAGYPDGTFLPEKEVNFAEAIKMIVAGLGYTPKANALGGYPGGYLAVAAEEGITEGVTVVSTLAANRGAVAIMVDNALDVDLMEQVSYGDSPEWKAIPGKTLLNSKLDVEEVKGVVTDISKTTKLDENEFKLTNDDGTKTYEMAIDVNTESLFLKEVKILHKDEEVVWVSVETAADDIVFDSVADKGDDWIKLDVADKKYDLLKDNQDNEDFEVYINYELSDIDDVEAGMYGYFIFDGKEIKSANLFDFDEAGFVIGVEDDEIEFIELNGAEEDLLILDDYDEVFVYNKDFTKAEVEDIDEDTVMFYWANEDDELFVMLVNDVVEGTVTRIRTNRVTIDGKNYSVTEASIISSDEGDEFEELDDVTEYDVIDEEVVLYLDLNGDIAALVTGAEATSETKYGLVTWFYEGRNPSVEIFTSEGEEVEYFFEERTDANVFAAGVIDDKLNDNETVWAIKYKLNSDGEIADGTVEIINEAGGRSPDNIKALKANIKKGTDRKYVEEVPEGDGNGGTYFIGSGTVIMKALDKVGADGQELDPEVIDYDTLVDMGFDNEEVLIFGEEGKTANMIVFLDPEFEGTKDDVFFGVVVDNPWKVGSNWFAEMDVFGEGKDEYKLKNSGQVKEGELIAFYLDGSNKVNDIVCGVVYDDKPDARIIVGTVYGRDGDYIEIGDTEPGLSGEYRVASGAVLYQLDGDELNLSKYDLDGTIRLTRIKEGDRIALLYDKKEKEVVAAIVAPKR